MRRFLYAGLLIASLVPRGSAELSNPEKPKPENVFLSLDGAPAMGDEKARVAIVEFADYQCPFCVMHAQQALAQIVAGYVKTGKIRYFLKDFPIESLHPQAFKRAEAARCAGEQGKYWEMHDRLVKSQQLEIIDELPEYVLAMGMDVPKFNVCMEKGTYADRIRKDIQDGSKYGVRGTPTFFVGMVDTETSGMNAVTVLYGAQPYAAFQNVLDQMLDPSEEQKEGDNETNTH